MLGQTNSPSSLLCYGVSLGTGQAYSNILQIYKKLMEKHPVPAVVVPFLFGSLYFRSHG